MTSSHFEEQAGRLLKMATALHEIGAEVTRLGQLLILMSQVTADWEKQRKDTEEALEKD